MPARSIMLAHMCVQGGDIQVDKLIHLERERASKSKSERQ